MASRRAISTLVAAPILGLIGLAVTTGAVALMFPGPAVAQDIVASEGTHALCPSGWTRSAHYLGTTAVILFVASGFIINVMIFGSVRPVHSGTNVVVGAVVIWLLWREKSSAR